MQNVIAPGPHQIFHRSGPHPARRRREYHIGNLDLARGEHNIAAFDFLIGQHHAGTAISLFGVALGQLARDHQQLIAAHQFSTPALVDFGDILRRQYSRLPHLDTLQHEAC